MPHKWTEETNLDREITVVFATNKTGFNFGTDLWQNKNAADDPTYKILHQYLDNEGRVVPETNNMNSEICKYLDELVDKEVKVWFLVCNN